MLGWMQVFARPEKIIQRVEMSVGFKPANNANGMSELSWTLKKLVCSPSIPAAANAD
jgi:hypothetical protein